VINKSDILSKSLLIVTPTRDNMKLMVVGDVMSRGVKRIGVYFYRFMA
jgi:hypothetical protein